MKTRIPLSYTNIDSTALAAVLEKYKDREHTEIVSDFEKLITQKVSAGFSLCVQSGTAALHLALRLLNVGPGDLVLVPSFTYVASVMPVLYVGAIPVFVDCSASTWNMDSDILEEAIKGLDQKGKKVKAIVLVHNYGNPCDMNSVLAVADRWQVPVIEDAAEALGSTVAGKHIGTNGAIGILSFNNNKINTTYGGGAMLTRDEKTYMRARFLATQAREDLPYYEHREMGYNYHMGPLNAAYGISQWQNVDRNVSARRRIFSKYKSALAGLSGFAVQRESDQAASNRWLSTFTFSETLKMEIERKMRAEGIETRPLWSPLHRQPLFKGSLAFDAGVAERLFKGGICLPSSSDLSAEQQDKVIDLMLS